MRNFALRTLPVLLCIFSCLASQAQKRGKLELMTANLSIPPEKSDDIRVYISVGLNIMQENPNVTALQGVDFTSGKDMGIDAVSTFKYYSERESGFTRNILFNPHSYGVGILTVNHPETSESFVLPGGDNDPAALLHEYSDCVIISVMMSRDKDAQIESIHLIDSIAGMWPDKPVFLMGSFYFTPESEQFRELTKHFQVLNNVGEHTYPASNPVLCFDYVCGYTGAGVSYESVQYRCMPVRYDAMHIPVYVIVKYRVPRTVRPPAVSEPVPGP